jgi:rhodanese-related sulfurtransferase
MIRNLLIATVFFAAPAAWAQQAASATADKAPEFKAHVLSRVELDALLRKPTQVLLLDVRRPDEVAGKGGFPVYLSAQISDLESNLAWIPKDRKIVTVSNHAGRAGKAADLLAAKGYKVAGAVGVELYEKDGGTLTRIAVPPAPADAAATTGSARR